MISLKYIATEGVNLLGSEVGAWLFDTTAETVTAVELVTNGEFPTDTSGWTAGGGATLASIAGELRITANGTAYPSASRNITCVVGKRYVISCIARRGTCVSAARFYVANISDADVTTSSTTNVAIYADFIATLSTHLVEVVINGTTTAGETAFFDNISCIIADEDLSATDQALRYHGTITKAAVNTGAGLMGYSGFSTLNFLSRQYIASLDAPTQLTVMAWVKHTGGVSQAIAGNYNNSGDVGGYMLYISASGSIQFSVISNASVQVNAIDPVALTAGQWTLVTGTMTTAGLLSLYKNDSLVASASGGIIGATVSTFKVGVLNITPADAFNGSIAGVRVISSVLTAAQIRTVYDREKYLFLANAPYRVVGTQYGLDYDVSALDYSESEESEESESMSGRNIETVYSRSIGVWNLTITNLQTVNLPTIRNFLHATRGNAEFTFDPYGTIAAPSQPATVITKANFKEQRSGNSDYFSIAQQFRIVKL